MKEIWGNLENRLRMTAGENDPTMEVDGNIEDMISENVTKFVSDLGLALMPAMTDKGLWQSWWAVPELLPECRCKSAAGDWVRAQGRDWCGNAGRLSCYRKKS